MSVVKEHPNHQRRRRKTMKNVKRILFGTRANRPCHYCGKKLKFDEATVDHKIPISQGGYDRIQNCVLACGPCNNAKRSLPYAEFLKKEKHERSS